MALTSPEARDIERRLREALSLLRDLDKVNRTEANELIDRTRNSIRSFRPDLFQPVPTPPASSGSERDVTE